MRRVVDLKLVRDEVKRLQEAGVEFEGEAILELCDEFSEIEDELVGEQEENERLLRDWPRERDADDEAAFTHAVAGFSRFDVLYVGPEGGQVTTLRRVGGTPLTVGDLRALIPEE